jgi:ankyrin repeat protein
MQPIGYGATAVLRVYLQAHVVRTSYLQYGATALMLASVYGHLAVLTALVAAGANVNAANEVLCEGDVWVYIQAQMARTLFLSEGNYGTHGSIRWWSRGGGDSADSCRG